MPSRKNSNNRLTEEGFEQAKALKEKMKNIKMEKIILSPLTRAIQTGITVFPPETNSFISSSV